VFARFPGFTDNAGSRIIFADPVDVRQQYLLAAPGACYLPLARWLGIWTSHADPDVVRLYASYTQPPKPEMTVSTSSNSNLYYPILLTYITQLKRNNSDAQSDEKLQKSVKIATSRDNTTTDIPSALAELIEIRGANGQGYKLAEGSMDALENGLHDHNPHVRAASSILLGQMQLPVNDCATLIKLIDDRDSDVRMAAILGLSGTDSEEVKAKLLSLLRNQDANFRLCAVVALGKQRNAAIDTLSQVLAHDKSLVVRKAAVQILGSLDDEKATAPLLNAAKDRNINVRLTAISAMYPIGAGGLLAPRGDLKVLDERCTMAMQIRNTACYHGEIYRLADILRHDQSNAVRIEAIKAMGHSHKYNLSALLANVHNPDPEVRGWVAEALGKTNSRAAVLPLMSLLTDVSPVNSIESMSGIDDYMVRDLAVEALGKLHDKRAVKAIIKAVKSSKELGLFRQAAEYAILDITGDSYMTVERELSSD